MEDVPLSPQEIRESRQPAKLMAGRKVMAGHYD